MTGHQRRPNMLLRLARYRFSMRLGAQGARPLRLPVPSESHTSLVTYPNARRTKPKAKYRQQAFARLLRNYRGRKLSRPEWKQSTQGICWPVVYMAQP